ncbi:MAG TPA: hypothetical protein VEQ59_22890 [Polyangiaceae bacterium]|nr:hypothetical protein [Polyangiaceae bacterium]
MLRLGVLASCAAALALSCTPAKTAPVAVAPLAVPSAPPAIGAAPATAPSAAPVVASPAEPGGLVRWKGSRVSLWAPQTMYRQTRLQYLRQDDPLVVVAVAELTAQTPDESRQMLAGAQRGAGIAQPEAVRHGNAQGFTGRAEPEANGLDRRVLGLADGLAAAVIIVQHAAAAAPQVTKILESVTLDANAPLDPLALNGITVGDHAGFAVSDGASHPVMFFEKGKKPPIADGEPSFMLMSLPYPKPEVADRELGAMLGLTLAHYAPKMDKANMNSFDVARQPAFVMAVPGTFENKPVGLYAFISRRADTAFVGVGRVRASAMKDAGPRFERLVKSIQLDDSIFGAK